MIHASRRDLAPLFTCALFLVSACAGGRDDSLHTNLIGTADGAVNADEDGEVEEEPIEEELDAGEIVESDTGEGAFDDAEIAADAIVSIEVADAGEQPDTTVVVEVARCGDGNPDPGEDCDRGPSNSDTVAGACRSNCRNAHCGDSVVDPGEVCDQGGSNSDSEADACRSDCTRPRCGDDVIDQGEQCDSGDARSNTAAGACRLDCRAARCGDGVRDANEACDDGNQVDADACRNNCRSARCGDRIVDPDEECDDGNTTNADGCQSTCRLAACGDGVVDSGEQCDDGNTSNNDGCRSNCQNGCVNAQQCTDNQFCNGAERCVNGLCAPPTGAPSLDDGVDCTLDACDEGTDRVVHTATNSLCAVDAPICSAATSTTQTAICDATRGCIERSTSQTCSDTASSCALHGDGSFTLTTYTPACNAANTSCGPATPSSRTCAANPATCANRVFTGVAAATCDPNSESCGTSTPATQNCAAVDRRSCAAGNVSFTQVSGTCDPASGCGSATNTTACSDPADTCTNAQRHTFAPTCSTAGCGAPTQTDIACTAAAAANCGANGPSGAPAVQRFTPACDTANPGQCSTRGAALAPEVCTARAAVCNANQRIPSLTTYVPACDPSGAASCAAGGVAQPDVQCPADPARCSAGTLTTSRPACASASTCDPGGVQTSAPCAVAATTCGTDNEQKRPALTVYSPACANSTTCSSGTASLQYCAQTPITCSGTTETRPGTRCENNACAATTRACSTATFSQCSAAGNAIETRQGTCHDGEGCSSDLLRSSACAAPTCTTVNLGSGSVSQACTSTCTVNTAGQPTCQQTCTTCPRGCSGNSCALVIIVEPVASTPGSVIANP